MSDLTLGDEFILKDGNTGKVTEVFSQGFNYHTLDKLGHCIKGQQYILKYNFKLELESISNRV